MIALTATAQVIKPPLSSFTRWGQRIAFSVVVAIYFTERIYHSDVFSLVVFGRWITYHLAVPSTDLWTALGNGAPWVCDYWLTAVLAYLLDSQLGSIGILLGGTLAALSLYLVCWFCFRSLSKDEFTSSILAILVSATCLFGFQFGPSLMAYPIFLSLIYGILSFWFSADEPRVSRLVTWTILFLLLVNLSQTFVLIPLIGVWLFFDSAVFREQGFIARRFWLFVLLSMVGSFLTPNFFNQLNAIGISVKHFALKLAEPSNAGSFFHFDMGFFFIVLSLYVLFVLSSARKLSLAEFSIVAVSALVPFMLRESAPFSVLIISAFVARSRGAADPRNQSNIVLGIGKLGEAVSGFSRNGSQGLLFFLLALAVVMAKPLVSIPVAHSALPVQQSERLLSDPSLLPVLNDPSYGGYLIYKFADERGIPRILAGIDNRAAHFVPVLRPNPDSWADSRLSSELLFGRLQPNSALCRSDSALCWALEESPTWESVSLAESPEQEITEMMRLFRRIR